MTNELPAGQRSNPLLRKSARRGQAWLRGGGEEEGEEKLGGGLLGGNVQTIRNIRELYR